ncbi:MAG: response regulator [Pseudomonadota bacterium]
MAKILLMDDDAEFSAGFIDFLERAGNEVDWTRSASEATDRAHEEEYDLVISDLYVFQGGLPVAEGGILLIHRLRSSDMLYSRQRRLRDIPILVISGAQHAPGQGHILDMAESVGADRGLAKPFTDREILIAIETLLAEPRPGLRTE